MLVRRIARALEAPLVVREPLQVLDAIVVLGAPLGRGDTLTPALAERVAGAVALYHAGGARRVVASGGVTRGATRAEADVIALALRDAGIPDVIVENASKDTAENARRTAALLPPGSSVWLVTQPFHGRRAARLFREAGFDAHVWHLENSLEYREPRRAVRWLVREYAAWAKLLVGL